MVPPTLISVIIKTNSWTALKREIFTDITDNEHPQGRMLPLSKNPDFRISGIRIFTDSGLRQFPAGPTGMPTGSIRIEYGNIGTELYSILL